LAPRYENCKQNPIYNAHDNISITSKRNTKIPKLCLICLSSFKLIDVIDTNRIEAFMKK